MDTRQLIALRLYRQHLTNPAAPIDAAGHLNGLQAQFFSNVPVGLQLRCGAPLPENWSDGIIKSWTVRGTVHAFPEKDLPLYLHEGRAHFLRPVDTMEADEFITKARKRYFADTILALIGEGADERGELKRRCCALGMTETEAQSVFNSWGGTIRALAEEGRLCFRPEEKKRFALCAEFSPLPEEPARLEILRRYLTYFGPATLADAAYYLGKPQKLIRQWLKKLPAEAMDVGGEPHFYCGAQSSAVPDIPACIFLSGFDQLMLGYEKSRSVFLPTEHLRGIFSLSGIVMPPVLLRGRVVGRWKRRGKKLDVTLFEPVSDRDQALIAAHPALPVSFV